MVSLKTAKESKKISAVISNDLLIAGRWPRLTPTEQRIILYLIWRIEPDDEDFKDYEIPIQDIAFILNNKKRLNGNIYRDFDSATDRLMQRIIKWTSNYKKAPSEKKCHWVSYIETVKGEGKVIVRFDKALKPFLLGLKSNFTNIGSIKILLSLSGHYSLRLYLLVMYHYGLSFYKRRKEAQKQGYFCENISWLKTFFDIGKNQYTRYQDFKKRVLIPSINDINKKTFFQITFEISKKDGRKATELKFTWHVKDEFITEDGIIFSEGENLDPLTQILINEFGVSKNKAIKLTKEFDEEYIKKALEATRQYFDKEEAKGNVINSTAGVAIKAINEGWKPQKEYIGPELKIQKLEAEKRRIEEEERKKREKEEAEKEEKKINDLFDNFLKLPEKLQEEIISNTEADLPGGMLNMFRGWDNNHPAKKMMIIGHIQKNPDLTKKILDFSEQENY